MKFTYSSTAQPQEIAKMSDNYDGSAYKSLSTEQLKKITGAGIPTRSEVWEKLRKNLNALKGPRNVLIVGDLGSGKSSFINTVITVLTGKYRSYVNVGNASCHITTCLQRIHLDAKWDAEDLANKPPNLPVLIDTIGLDNQGSANASREEDTTTTNSKIINLIINGKIPENCDLLHAIKSFGKGRKVKEFSADQSKAIDAIIVVIPADNAIIPQNLLEDIHKQATVEMRKVPVFGVVTKMDKCKPDTSDEREKKRTEIAAAIRIDPQRVLLCSNYQPNEPWNDKEDISILEFMCLICDPHITAIDSQRLEFEDSAIEKDNGQSRVQASTESEILGADFWDKAFRWAILVMTLAVVITLMVHIKSIWSKDYKKIPVAGVVTNLDEIGLKEEEIGL